MCPVMENDGLFILVRDGVGSFIINGEEFVVAKGHVAWIQASQVLTIIPEFSSALELWVCVYDYQLLNYFLFNKISITDETGIVNAIPVLPYDEEDVAPIIALFEQYERLSRLSSRGSAVVRSSYLRKIELLYNRAAKKHSENYNINTMPLGRRVSLYIATHSTQALTAADVAEALGDVTENDVKHALLVATGMNFNQYYMRLKLVFTLSYFLYYSLQFDYIAACAGFSMDVGFYRKFKAMTGMTPQAYRERMLCDGSNGRIYRGMILSETIISAMNYLYENFSEHIDVDTIAGDLYTTGSVLRSHFRDYLHTSCKQILALFRVRYAESLLTTTDLPIVDISIESGFSSDRTLGRVFAEINGMSPGEFRKMRSRKVGK